MEVADRYARVADGFTARLAGVRAEQWQAASTCPDWSVRDLVAHVIGTHRRVAANVTGAEAPDVDAHGDVAGQWAEATAAIGSLLADPETAERTVGGMFGEQSFSSLVSRLLCTDTLVHTWDLARSTGQDEALDPDAVRAAAEFLTPLDDVIRRPGGFAPKLEPPAGADEQTALLAFCGRRAQGSPEQGRG